MPDGVVLPVLAHPGSKRDGILGERAGALRVAVTAPPEKGKANAAIQSVLADALWLQGEADHLVVRRDLAPETVPDRRDDARGIDTPADRP